LPKTKIALYQRFTQAFYEWKQEVFPISLKEREDLNNALSQLALRAIDNEKSWWVIRESFAINVMGESLFQLAHHIGWLNLVYRDMETNEPLYAFFHPTFQEYFAALAIDDWHFFMNHVPNNPAQGTYRILNRSGKRKFCSG
jgi:predicted NACHT family NTPase